MYGKQFSRSADDAPVHDNVYSTVLYLPGKRVRVRQYIFIRIYFIYGYYS